MTKPKTLDQLRAEKERAETQLAQEQQIRYNNFRKLKSKQKKTWFAALW